MVIGSGMVGRRLFTAPPVILVALSLFACAKPEQPRSARAAGPLDHVAPPIFREITEQVGLTFRHHVTVGGNYALTELMGSGCAIFDANGDGRLDLFFLDAGEQKERGAPDRLFLRTDDGRYRETTEIAGLDSRGFGTGVAAGDLDNDGDIDLYVGNWGGDALYLNDGSGRFTDVTTRAGIRNNRWTTSIALVDYDLDGFLDVYVTTYVRFEPTKECSVPNGRRDYCTPAAYDGDQDVLYHNRGDGTFEDVSSRSGIDTIARNGLGVIVEDFNADGWPDIYVANDGQVNDLWINQRGERFVDEALPMGIAVSGAGVPQASMGVTTGDVEGDGDLDLFITNIVNESNILYTRADPFGFRDSTMTSGLGVLSRAHTGFGAVLFDADHDADLDLAVANGRVSRGPVVPGAAIDSHWNDYADRNHFFVNDGSGTFAPGGAGAFGERVEVGRALGAADLDQDGDLDLVLTGVGTPARIFENTRESGHWLKVRARDGRLNRDALGARVIVLAGGRRQQRTVGSAVSYLTSCVAPVHFGLGTANDIDGIEVVWPGGEIEAFPGTPVDRLITVTRGGGQKR